MIDVECNGDQVCDELKLAIIATEFAAAAIEDSPL